MKINLLEQGKDKNGNDMKILTIEDKKVFVNSKYNKEVYDAVNEDSDIEIEKDGNFWKIKPASVGVVEPIKTYSKTGAITQAMERKEASIIKHQEAKEESMAIMGSCSDATAIVEAKLKWHDLTDEAIQKEWDKWQKYFLQKRKLGF